MRMLVAFGPNYELIKLLRFNIVKIIVNNYFHGHYPTVISLNILRYSDQF